jgi:hypothetical protein
LVERDSQQKELVGLMQSNLESFREGRYNNQSWTLLTIFGVSGSGKTRLSFEVVENLRSAIIDCSPKQTFKFVDIFVKFTNGDKPGPIAKGDCKKLVACCLSRCLHTMEISQMMTEVSVNRPEDLIKPIKSVFDVQDTDQLVIFLRV